RTDSQQNPAEDAHGNRARLRNDRCRQLDRALISADLGNSETRNGQAVDPNGGAIPIVEHVVVILRVGSEPEGELLAVHNRIAGVEIKGKLAKVLGAVRKQTVRIGAVVESTGTHKEHGA